MSGTFVKGQILTAAQLNALIPVVTPPSITRMWSGAVTSTGFKVNFDVAGATSSNVTTLGIVVSTNSDVSSPVFSSADTAPVVSLGRSQTYYTGAFTASGLTADTNYYYAAKINGVVQTATIGRLRTAPTNGTATTFSFVVGSCTNPAYQYGNPYAPVTAIAPAFVVHIGDVAYSDIAINDAGAQRDTNTRQWRNTSGVTTMNLMSPIVYMPDDHDFGPDDNHWDKAVATKATHAQIGANTRLVVRETTPLYTQWNTMVLSQAWTWGRVRFILPDLRSQRRYVDGGPTFLGDGSDPPTGYDHKAALFAAIDQAASDGMKMLVFFSTSTWSPAIFDSWDRYNSAEQTELADKFRNSPVHVMLIAGDAHQGIIDDGTNSDRSSTRDGKLPLIVSSGWNVLPFHQITAAAWNGGDGDVTGVDGNGTMFVKVTVEDNGGNDIHWEVEFFGAPLSGSTATSLGVFRDDDGDVEVGFTTTNALQVETLRAGTMRVEKSWLGPIPGCTVAYTWASGPSGTLTFNPNCNTAEIPRAYTDGAPDTVTLSSPVRCALSSNIVRDMEWFTPASEVTAWLAEVTTRPNDEQVYALNTFIEGLISDGLWSQILKLWWLGAPSMQASTIELKSPGTNTLIANGAMGFSALAGWIGGNKRAATVPYLETGYAIPGGNQNSISATVRCIDALLTSSGEFGGDNYYINPHSTADDFRTRNGSTTTDSLVRVGGAVAGNFGFSRTGSANYKKFVDGVAVETVTRTSSAPNSTTMWLCGFQNTLTPLDQQSGGRRVAMAMIGAGMSDADMLLYYNRETTFLQAVGTIA